MLQENIVPQNGALRLDPKEGLHSLKVISAAKVATTLWMDQNIKKRIVSYFRSKIYPDREKSGEERNNIESYVFYVIKNLHLLDGSAVPKYAKDCIRTIAENEGKSMNQWIEYHDKHVLDTSEYSEYSAVDLIDNIKWTVRGKIDFEKTAKTILADQYSCLSSDHKFKLACVYCLENEIAVYVDSISESALLDIKIDMHPMVFFWTAYFKGDSTIDKAQYKDDNNRRDNNTSVNEHILKLLMNDNASVKRTINEVPIKYMWDRLSKDEKDKNISLFESSHNQDLKCCLLSGLDYNQQQQLSMINYVRILEYMLSDCSWIGCFLPTALDVLSVNNPSSEEFWQRSSMLFKCIYYHICYSYQLEKTMQRFVEFSLSEKNIDIMVSVLKRFSEDQKKSLIYSEIAMKLSYYLIKNNKCYTLALLVMHSFSSEEDTSAFKKKLIESDGLYLVDECFADENYCAADNFVNWALKPEDWKLFRDNFLNPVSLEIVLDDKEFDLKKLDDYVKWCANHDPKKIIAIKNLIPRVRPYATRLISVFIEKGQYELLNQYLNWCFMNNKQRISRFKSNMYKRAKDPYCCRELVRVLIKDDKSCKLADKFLDWAFKSSEEKEAFKNWLLKAQGRKCSVCTDFLVAKDLAVADKFLEWCLPSLQKINRFKNELMLSKDMEKVLRMKLEKSSWQKVIKWFNPSKMTVIFFKIIFRKEKYPKKKYPNEFYKLLNEFVKAGDSAQM